MTKITAIQHPERFTAERLAVLYFDATTHQFPHAPLGWKQLDPSTQRMVIANMQALLDALVAEGILA